MVTVNEKVDQGHLTESFWSGREALCVTFSMRSIKNDGGVAAFFKLIINKIIAKENFQSIIR